MCGLGLGRSHFHTSGDGGRLPRSAAASNRRYPRVLDPSPAPPASEHRAPGAPLAHATPQCPVNKTEPWHGRRVVSRAKDAIERLFSKAGVTINGSNPWDIQVKDERLYARLLRDGSMSLGEAYMDGWWDCRQVDAVLCRHMACSPNLLGAQGHPRHQARPGGMRAATSTNASPEDQQKSHPQRVPTLRLDTRTFWS